MEQDIFVKYKNKLTDGTSEKVKKNYFWNKNNVILKIAYWFNFSALLKNTFLFI